MPNFTFQKNKLVFDFKFGTKIKPNEANLTIAYYKKGSIKHNSYNKRYNNFTTVLKIMKDDERYVWDAISNIEFALDDLNSYRNQRLIIPNEWNDFLYDLIIYTIMEMKFWEASDEYDDDVITENIHLCLRALLLHQCDMYWKREDLDENIIPPPIEFQ